MLKSSFNPLIRVFLCFVIKILYLIISYLQNIIIYLRIYYNIFKQSSIFTLYLKTNAMENLKEVTIYYSSAFGVTKVEGKIIDFGTKKYAQYDNASFFKFIQKGKRKPSGYVQGFHPYLVILEGHNHLNPLDPFGESKIDSNGTKTTMTRFSSFDERYKTEFDSKLNEYLKDKSVLMDYRHTVNTLIINK